MYGFLASAQSRLMMCALMVSGLLLTETTNTLDFSKLIDAITSVISVDVILGIIAAILGAGMIFVLMWFGARKLINAVITAVKTGKLKI